MFESALIPISFREPVQRLTEMISFLEKLGTRRVVLLHVSTGSGGTAAEARLSRTASAVSDSVAATIQSRVRIGSPPYEITTSADEENADYVCIPWKQKSWIQRALVGSTTQDVIRLSGVPVLVFKRRRGLSVENGFRLLYPTDFQDTDRFVVPYLRFQALSADELVLVTVRDRAPDPAAERREHRACAENLARLAEEVKENFTDVVTKEVIGSPKRQIPRIARRESVEFLVVGKSDRPDALASMMGSVAEEVANSAPCSVFIVGRPYLRKESAT